MFSTQALMQPGWRTCKVHLNVWPAHLHSAHHSSPCSASRAHPSRQDATAGTNTIIITLSYYFIFPFFSLRKAVGRRFSGGAATENHEAVGARCECLSSEPQS